MQHLSRRHGAHATPGSDRRRQPAYVSQIDADASTETDAHAAHTSAGVGYSRVGRRCCISQQRHAIGSSTRSRTASRTGNSDCGRASKKLSAAHARCVRTDHAERDAAIHPQCTQAAHLDCAAAMDSAGRENVLVIGDSPARECSGKRALQTAASLTRRNHSIRSWNFPE